MIADVLQKVPSAKVKLKTVPRFFCPKIVVSLL